MNYYGSQELANSFRTVRKNTLVVAEEIPEQHYGFRAAPDTRTVAEILVHLAVMPQLPKQVQFLERRSTLVGFDFFAFMSMLKAEEQSKRSKAEIMELLRSGGEEFANLLEGSSEEFLGQRVVYPPGMTPASKSRFEMLMSIKEHEMHHRAQLMLIERILGIVPHLTREMLARIAAIQAQKGGV